MKYTSFLIAFKKVLLKHENVYIILCCTVLNVFIEPIISFYQVFILPEQIYFEFMKLEQIISRVFITVIDTFNFFIRTLQKIKTVQVLQAVVKFLCFSVRSKQFPLSRYENQDARFTNLTLSLKNFKRCSTSKRKGNVVWAYRLSHYFIFPYFKLPRSGQKICHFYNRKRCFFYSQKLRRNLYQKVRHTTSRLENFIEIIFLQLCRRIENILNSFSRLENSVRNFKLEIKNGFK